MTGLILALACLAGLAVGYGIRCHESAEFVGSTQKHWQNEARKRGNAEGKLARLQAVADAARLEREAHDALPLIPHGEAHDRWVSAHRALHDALDIGDVMGGSDAESGDG